MQIANGFLWDNFLAATLVVVGLWFSWRTRFIQATFLGDVIRLLSIRKTEQGLTPFQAFCLSTGARVGVGNIAGIGLAVTIGGPGAIFWMWVSAFFGAATGFRGLLKILSLQDRCFGEFLGVYTKKMG